MTPAARIAAAIDVLDQVFAGNPAEKSLINWARRSRFAGSGDRAAVRDHVFDALRNRKSYTTLGGAENGRGAMIGALRANNLDPAQIFNGEGYAPSSLTPEEQAASGNLSDLSELVRLDCPEWLAPMLRNSLGEMFESVCGALKFRAPVFLRVNLRKTSREGALETLLKDGITTKPHALSETALEVVENPRKILNSSAFRDGLVELQDAGSQHIMDQIPVAAGQRVLDYCAGGGGKTLAMAAREKAVFFAHDVDPSRMADLPTRAKRAGVRVKILSSDDASAAAPFDVVLCDVPCSGSGAWRRSPDAKWNLTKDRLEDLIWVQDEILQKAATYVGQDGTLAFATCSLLNEENRDQINKFLENNSDWHLASETKLTPIEGCDGFYLAILKRKISKKTI
ncbi:RsmB/NOP family class I SAM-dependent RNA methyltransferase [Pseudohalocynthiibacter aestuariivivens]|jgi:16S rRNA (cytosine967-C5)-methyltransferase|uniref:RsmB/NOP family class I SAM-dependent RNA methyltransferase n=1 Tax=Pseudohalocynthiibacter aestuariivivens TaxID=1591409 RepID=A0ABV5JII1_9RHOB|nr:MULTISPECIES: RsmB/NOP family class I SAM-dependent RNA methyltransferase [Pseudohalocynthiibacter]MBS9716104.1 RsmB/NOP family class I SAM-dependent RNA methyltransferase [Pseudohalocynthiibacter aestuariivivens]MCK0101089.1 RsmB/NOP family class I SAM-dependent RNA methyltransferase [Pseudohalocynthiibacter sp. F2068]